MTRLVPSLRWFVALVAFLGLVIPSAADAQSPTTFSQTTIPVSGAFTVAMKAPVTTTTPLVAGGPGGVSVLTNNGAGSFLPSLSFPGASAPSLPAVAIGDVNGDTYDDIVTLTTILFGQAGGTYIQQSVGAPSGAGSVDVGNVNGDAYADMVFSAWGSNSAILRLGKPGTPGSWSPGATVSVPVGANPFSARIGKLNGDAYGDVVVANGSNNSITVYLGGPGFPYLTNRADYQPAAPVARIRMSSRSPTSTTIWTLMCSPSAAGRARCPSS